MSGHLVCSGLAWFHVKRPWHRAAEFANLELNRRQGNLLQRYGSWLVNEAIPAGGIGPEESDRIERRHVADSLLFASLLPDPVAEVWDLGSGVGLPGIPLAIALPETRFLLVDRSGRRVDLMRRVLRVLDLENCQVTQGEIEHLEGRVETIVSRATLPPETMLRVANSHLVEGGRAIVAGSWRERPRHPGWETVEIPSYVLDQTIWLLMMRRE